MRNKDIKILKTNYGYKIIENAKCVLFSRIFSIIVFILVGIGLFFIKDDILIFPIELFFKIILLFLIILNIYYLLFYNEIIKIFKDKIIFCLKLKPWKQNIIEINKINIKEISINYERDFNEHVGEVYFYNLDLIDNEFNAYGVAKLIKYELILKYGNELEKLLNIKLLDYNDIEGYGNVYKRRII